MAPWHIAHKVYNRSYIRASVCNYLLLNSAFGLGVLCGLLMPLGFTGLVEHLEAGGLGV